MHQLASETFQLLMLAVVPLSRSVSAPDIVCRCIDVLNREVLSLIGNITSVNSTLITLKVFVHIIPNAFMLYSF
jgi:hypothetical protein